MSPLLFVDLLLGAAAAALLADAVRERRALRRFVRDLGPLPGDPFDRVCRLAGLLYTRPRTPDDPPYLSPLFQSVGATPSDLIAHGGTCSGAARLLILTLAEAGVRAHQIALYHTQGQAQHSLVEVTLPDGRAMVVDPTYGFYYADGAGGLVGLADLQRGVRPVFRSLPYSALSSYPDHPYYRFDFALSRTVNWTMSPVRRLAYRLLRRLMPGRVDRLRPPVLLEWPQVLLLLALLATAAALHGAAALVTAAGRP